jgi:hypothetical protein
MKMKNNKRFAGLITLAVVIMVTLGGCMSMLMSSAKSQYKDYGVYDKSIPTDQMCELRFGLIIIKSFDGVPVNWGNTPNTNMGHIKVPAGEHTIVFDWIQETTQLTDVRQSGNTTTYTYTTTTSSVKDISFSDVNMAAGHNYFIGGSKIADGSFRFWLLDQTSMPSGFYGDNVPKAPKENRKTPTKFEGTWKNSFGESFRFTGNTWLQILPPYTGTNTGPDELRMIGTFEYTDDTMTLFFNGVEMPDQPKWAVNMANDGIKAQEQIYLYKYSLDGSNLLLELPYMLPETVYVKQ